MPPRSREAPAAAANQVDAAISDFKDTLSTADAQLSELRKLRHSLSAVIEEGEQRLSSLASNAPRPTGRSL